MATKRARGSNFSKEESYKLLRLVTQHAAILENKKTDAATWRAKKDTWNALTAEFNATAASPRTMEQLRSRHEKTKKRAREMTDPDRIYSQYRMGRGRVQHKAPHYPQRDLLEPICQLTPLTNPVTSANSEQRYDAGDNTTQLKRESMHVDPTASVSEDTDPQATDEDEDMEAMMGLDHLPALPGQPDETAAYAAVIEKRVWNGYRRADDSRSRDVFDRTSKLFRLTDTKTDLARLQLEVARRSEGHRCDLHDLEIKVKRTQLEDILLSVQRKKELHALDVKIKEAELEALLLDVAIKKAVLEKNCQ